MADRSDHKTVVLACLGGAIILWWWLKKDEPPAAQQSQEQPADPVATFMPSDLTLAPLTANIPQTRTPELPAFLAPALLGNQRGQRRGRGSVSSSKLQAAAPTCGCGGGTHNGFQERLYADLGSLMDAYVSQVKGIEQSYQENIRSSLDQTLYSVLPSNVMVV